MDLSALTSAASGKGILVEKGCYAFIPDPLPPHIELNWELVSILTAAGSALAELAGAARIVPNPHLLIRPFIGREAVLSSRIEGTQASLSDVFMFQGADGKTPSAEREDIEEVINYIDAVEYGLTLLDELPLSLRFIKNLHAVLMRGVRGKDQAPGDFRTVQNWIGPTGCTKKTARYVPPPVPEMKQCLNALENYINSLDGLPSLVRLALIHYQFEAIHPFLDGNGRIGRLLITIILCKERLLPQPLLYLSAYFENNRREYYDLLLSVSLEGNWVGWISFFLRGVEEQSRDALLRSRLLVDLKDRYRVKLQTSRVTGLQLQLLDYLFDTPIVTVNRIAKKLNITARAAQLNIDKLIEHGILREITGGKRNRIFAADEILRVTETNDLSLPAKATTS